MRVAIDVSPLVGGHSHRGVGFYTKNLVAELGKKVETVNFNNLDFFNYDLIHIPFFNPFVNTFPSKVENCSYIVTIHDLIPLLYPKNYPSGLKGKLRFISQKKKAQNAKAIITDSETSKKDIIRFLDIDPEKIKVIYLGPQKGLKKHPQGKLAEIKKKYNLPDKFVLYIGDINYNKNIPNLIKACKYANISLIMVGRQAVEIENLGQDLRLLKGPMDYLRFILGKPHPQLAHYKNILQAIKSNKKVYRLGFVSADDLGAVMQLATLYCQPSLYEGFGLPLLEAFSMELAVVASKTQALVEVGADACLYADPDDYKDLGEKIKLIASDKNLRNKLVNKGRERLKQFSWTKAANETYAVYEKASK